MWSTLSPEQQHRTLAGYWDDPVLERAASVSLWQFVHEHLSQDAWDLVGQASGLAHYEQSSLLEVLVAYFGLFHDGQVELVEGSDALIHVFVRALAPGTVRLSTRIDELALTEDGVEVRGRRFGARLREHTDYVVCCVPAPALDRITVTPGLPHAQRYAVRGISYASSTKTVLHLTRRRWELQDGIHGGGSFTDLPIQQCWYPSDNAVQVEDGVNGSTRRHWVARDPLRPAAPSANSCGTATTTAPGPPRRTGPPTWTSSGPTPGSATPWNCAPPTARRTRTSPPSRPCGRGSPTTP
ncbi:FAD-dependent oxidoreductase [Kitasatospora sp. NPDC096077]|uniref:flavin monoamine oxidase family protein n=1 Tax=Kitasatospora sp. NPDC096077 TaxID=3155544 RepID=UPI0033315890